MKLCLTLAAAALLAAGAASAQTADEIVKKHVDAIGGAEAWKKVTSLKMIGSMNAGGMELPITMQKLNGKGWRMDMEGMGTKNYMILTSKEGWVYMPIQQMTKVTPMEPEQVTAMQDQLQIGDNLANAAALGSKVEMVDKEKVGDADCYKLKVTNKNGDVTTDYVDAKTYYIVRETKKVKSEGKDVEATTNMSNYQKLPEGIVIAMSVEQEGQPPFAMKTVEVNTIKDESTFKPSDN